MIALLLAGALAGSPGDAPEKIFATAARRLSDRWLVEAVAVERRPVVHTPRTTAATPQQQHLDTTGIAVFALVAASGAAVSTSISLTVDAPPSLTAQAGAGAFAVVMAVLGSGVLVDDS